MIDNALRRLTEEGPKSKSTSRVPSKSEYKVAACPTYLPSCLKVYHHTAHASERGSIFRITTFEFRITQIGEVSEVDYQQSTYQVHEINLPSLI